ncbi:MAG: hypothetical protein P4L87_11465, partial [Formivibrio sp.]|nr:hypothetical protein [Formivibrio sp.]
SFCFFIIVGAHKNPTLWKYPAWSFKLGRLVKKIQKSQSEVFYLSAESSSKDSVVITSSCQIATAGAK